MMMIRPKIMKIGSYIACLLCAMLVTLLSCVDEEVPIFPIIVFNEVKIISKVGVNFSGSITNISEDKIEDFGIIWKEGENTPLIANALRLSLNSPPNTPGGFSQVVSSFEEETAYSARIYMKTSENTYYSNVQFFKTASTSIPVIHEIVPEFVNFGDTLNIIGEGFGIDTDNTMVFIENTLAEILATTDSHIKVKIPYFRTSSSLIASKDSLAVTVQKFKTISIEKYVTIKPPTVYSTSAREVYAGYEFDIWGRGFHPYHTKAYLDGEQVELMGISYNLVTLTAPYSIEGATREIKIYVGNKSVTAGDLKVIAPKVSNDFSDLQLRYNTTYRIKGQNLDNEFLDFYLDDRVLDKNNISSEEVEILFPNDVCNHSYDLSMKLSNIEEKWLVNKNTVEPSMSNFQISKYDFGAEINLELTNTAEHNVEFYVGGVIGGYETRRTSETSARIILPDDFFTGDGWLDIEMRICEFSIIAESVFQFPKPIIETPIGKFEPYQFIELGGQYILGGHVEVYLNDEFLIKATNANVSNGDVGFIMPQHPDGNYTLKLKVNGQWSNEVQVEVVNTWEKLRTISDLFALNGNGARSTGGIFTIRENELYFSDIFSGTSGKFYSMDLTTMAVTELSKQPTGYGSFTHSGDLGYLNYLNKLYQYDFLNDNWTELKSSPYEVASWPYPSALNGDKLFIFESSRYYRTFDLITEEWKQHFNAPISIEGSTNYKIVQDGSSVYMIHLGDLFVFNLDQSATVQTYNMGNSYNLPGVYGYRGIKLDDELLIAGKYGINLYKTNGSSWRVLNVPTYSYLLAGENQYLYIIGESGIWRYNFDLAK